MMKLTGKNGRLRIYDGSLILHESAPLDDATVDIVKFGGVSTYTNISTDVKALDASAAENFIIDTNDGVFIGSTVKFGKILYLVGSGTSHAAGAGSLSATYYNGSAFVALEKVYDGTESGSNCFGQDGIIGFRIPKNWAMGGNANLDSDKYYIRLMVSSDPTTAPDADVLCPCGGQYFEIAFVSMDFSGPIGKPKTEENLVQNKGNADAYQHYIEGSDALVFEPQSISFSCFLDDVVNKIAVLEALDCGTPGNDRWTETGETTKGTTKNDSINFNPDFVEADKRTVTVQMIFEGTSENIGYSYYEVYFPGPEQQISEAEDGVTLSAAGGCYGVVERINAFGDRY